MEQGWDLQREGVGLRAFWKLQRWPRNPRLRPTNGEGFLQGLREKALPAAALLHSAEKSARHLSLLGKF